MVGEGIKAIEFIRDNVVPWRREHAKNIAKLEQERKRIEIEEIKNKIERDKNENHDKHLLELERMRLENEKLETQLWDAKMDLAFKFVEKAFPQLSEKDRVKYLGQMLQPLSDIISSPLNLEAVDESDEEKQGSS